MRRLAVALALGMIARASEAQGSPAACGMRPDSTARQVIGVFGDVRVCLLAFDVRNLDAEVPREWAAKSSTLVLETQAENDNRRAVVAGSNVRWTINGRTAPLDSIADHWQAAVVELLDAKHEADELRSRDAALRDLRDSLPARIKAIERRIEEVKKRDRELNERIFTARQGDVIEAQIFGLEASLASAQMRASSERSRAETTRDEQQRRAAERAAQAAENEARRIQAQIQGLRRQLPRGNPERTIAAAQDELRELRPEHTLTMLKLQLAGYESTNVPEVDKALRDLDAPARQPLLDARIAAALARLRTLLGASKH